MNHEDSAEARHAEIALNSFLQLVGTLAKAHGVMGVFSAGCRYTVGTDETPHYFVGSVASGILHMPMQEFGPLVAAMGIHSGNVVQQAATTAFGTPEARA